MDHPLIWSCLGLSIYNGSWVNHPLIWLSPRAYYCRSFHRKGSSFVIPQTEKVKLSSTTLLIQRYIISFFEDFNPEEFFLSLERGSNDRYFTSSGIQYVMILRTKASTFPSMHPLWRPSQHTSQQVSPNSSTSLTLWRPGNILAARDASDGQGRHPPWQEALVINNQTRHFHDLPTRC